MSDSGSPVHRFFFCHGGGLAGNGWQKVSQDLGNRGWGRSLLPADSVVSLYNAFLEVFLPMYHHHLEIALLIPRTLLLNRSFCLRKNYSRLDLTTPSTAWNSRACWG